MVLGIQLIVLMIEMLSLAQHQSMNEPLHAIYELNIERYRKST
jgi:hypothetical protein